MGSRQATFHPFLESLGVWGAGNRGLGADGAQCADRLLLQQLWDLGDVSSDGAQLHEYGWLSE